MVQTPVGCVNAGRNRYEEMLPGFIQKKFKISHSRVAGSSHISPWPAEELMRSVSLWEAHPVRFHLLARKIHLEDAGIMYEVE